MNSAYEKKLQERIKLLEEQNKNLINAMEEKKKKIKEYYQRPEVKERNRRSANEYYQKNKDRILKKAKEKYLQNKIKNQTLTLNFD